MSVSNSSLLAIGDTVIGASPLEVLTTDAQGALVATNTPTVKKVTAGTDYTNGEGVQGTFILPNGISFVAVDKDAGIYQLLSTDVNNTVVVRNAFPSGDLVFGLGHGSNVAGAIVIQIGGSPIATIAGLSSPYYPAGLSLMNGYGIAPFTLGYRETAVLTAQTDFDVVLNCTSGTFAVTLLSVSGRKGRAFIVKNSGAGVITLTPNGVETTETTTVIAGAVARLIAATTGWIAV